MKRWLLPGLIALGLASSGSAAQSDYLVLVTNENSGDVSVIRGSTLQVERAFPAGKRPRGVEVSPDGAKIWVALSGSPRMGPGADPDRARLIKADKSADGLGVLDLKTGKLERRLFVGSDPEEFAFGCDGRLVFVANEDTAQMSVWDSETGEKTTVADVSEEPEGVAVSPESGEVYLTCEDGGDLFIFGGADAKRLAHLPIGRRPRSIAFAPGRALIALEGEGAVAIVNTSERRLVSKVKIETPSALPMGIAVSKDGLRAFVTTGRGGRVAVIDVFKAQVIADVPVGKRPWGIALSPDGKTLFTANGPSNDVSVIDVTSLREVVRIRVGEGPWGVAIAPVK
jgi:YVTN family beta-propeller protein